MITVHAGLGVATIVAALVGWLHARARIRSGKAYESGVYLLASLLIVLQSFVGVWVWIDASGWMSNDLRSQAHGVVGIAVVVLVRLGLVKADRERWAESAYQIAARTFLATIFVLALSWWLGQGN